MLDILYRDDHLIAIHKPSGLLVHRTNLDRHETRFAVQLLRDQIGQRVYPVHRLDKGTSGVLLFALDPDIGRAVSGQFERQEVAKKYLAVVRGHPPETGEIDYPLVKRPDDYEWTPDAEGAPPQEAVTRYRRLAVCELPYEVDRYPTSRYALVELEPLTGRRHQLRRHLKHISHPIIGDATYGKGKHNRLFQTLFGCYRMLLANLELQVRHPVSDKVLTITAPLAEDFAVVLAQLGWKC
ncbi:tRNA pseudouridine65 synthase [Novimethylophilus kurashikiensis]|uniref:tRNA pseudouridine synthase C n=1 Tax=Novimethylophilus kurashikiensis TaxID=1825523 RepID=A0A2R5F1X2_9PROT|nr:pseudouridine synthase [Novimethylophilus kurashikiensis]GBG12660.1 tRNA pseudouridine65 synthase [Novimethylophilus kurashikiensis]